MGKYISKYWLIVIIIVIGAIFIFIRQGYQFELPKGETVPLKSLEKRNKVGEDSTSVVPEDDKEKIITPTDDTTLNTNNESRMLVSSREIFVTDNIKHSIPLDEILSGGPPKDGIPSIDNPKFVSTKEADTFLTDKSVGQGIIRNGDVRFYPYQILVWHEIVNDVVGGDPLVVTYCPLCATGIVYERTLDGEIVEFGVSGKLWQSNLLMYNRSDDQNDESLWSQVLGEAVLGTLTGTRLVISSSDTVRYGDWKQKHPDTVVLSKETGAIRSYGNDPYGSYYTDDTVGFGATFDDNRLHPKSFVLGVEIDGKYKAYYSEALDVGETTDSFAGRTLTLEKSDIGEVRIFVGKEKTSLPYIGGFWFSWLAVHPDTELYK